MEKVRMTHRRQAGTRMKKMAVSAVFIFCYAWFAWQLYVSPLHMAVFAFAVPAAAWLMGIAKSRRRTTVLMEVRELS